ncbi:hypothetical protein [Desulfosoma caldarium]|uniref:hypothetical protein n=1 Tax=Desulfosoma caldarium TaxID=610254 RepID=UPI000F4765D8|nr:hypothetical protein [Desulfosoma caldarium]
MFQERLILRPYAFFPVNSRSTRISGPVCPKKRRHTTASFKKLPDVGKRGIGLFDDSEINVHSLNTSIQGLKNGSNGPNKVNSPCLGPRIMCPGRETGIGATADLGTGLDAGCGRRLIEVGPNKLAEVEKISRPENPRAQFKRPLIYVD